MNEVSEETPASLTWDLDGKGQCYTLTTEETTLGRSRDCQVHLPHTTVSRMHAAISFQNGTYFIKDLDSSSGTSIGAQKLNPLELTALQSGDLLHIGRQKVTFSMGVSPSVDNLDIELNFTNDDLINELRQVREVLHTQTESLLKDPETARQLTQTIDGTLNALTDFLESRFREYQVLQEITHIIVGILDLRELLSTVLKVASRVLNADRGFILLYDASHNDLRSMVTRHFEDDGTTLEHDFNFSQTIARSCFEKREPVIIDDAIHHEQFASSHSIMASSIRSVVCLPLIKGDQVTGVLYLDNLTTPSCFGIHQLSFLKAFAAQTALALDNAQLYTQAVTDSLTKLYNRKFVDERIGEELVRAQRYQRPCSVLLLDIDHFKKVNDTYGHHAGDVVLQQVSACLQEQARGSDVVARYGGEEFLMLLTETDHQGALIFAERLRKAVADLEMEMEVEQLKIKVTLSCGLVTYRPDFRTSVTAFVNEADQGLYRAKQSGRNRVCHMLEI